MSILSSAWYEKRFRLHFCDMRQLDKVIKNFSNFFRNLLQGILSIFHVIIHMEIFY